MLAGCNALGRLYTRLHKEKNVVIVDDKMHDFKRGIVRRVDRLRTIASGFSVFGTTTYSFACKSNVTPTTLQYTNSAAKPHPKILARGLHHQQESITNIAVVPPVRGIVLVEVEPKRSVHDPVGAVVLFPPVDVAAARVRVSLGGVQKCTRISSSACIQTRGSCDLDRSERECTRDVGLPCISRQLGCQGNFSSSFSTFFGFDKFNVGHLVS
jgi:hypothetical protein